MMSEEPSKVSENADRRTDSLGLNFSQEEQASIWNALSQTPGIGVSIVDSQGTLLFVNDTSLELFSGSNQVDYQTKKIGDFYSPEFTAERLELIQEVIKTGKPKAIRHVFLGRRIVSTLWPIRDRNPPFDRVIVVSKYGPEANSTSPDIDTVESEFIELGALNVLTKRELEVFVMFGHGLNIPTIAKILYRSPKTLERHKTSIAKKLCLKSQADMVRIVSQLGLTYEDAMRTRLPFEPPPTGTPNLGDLLR